MRLVERLKTRREFADLRVSPLLIASKAVCLALRRTPSSTRSGTNRLSRSCSRVRSISDRHRDAARLIVPNIKGAESLSLTELAAALTDVVATARARRAQPTDMAGGTFTITNIGVFGVDAGSPILHRRSRASCALARSLGGRGWSATELTSGSNRVG